MAGFGGLAKVLLARDRDDVFEFGQGHAMKSLKAVSLF
jgi:hypothetical protein